MSSLPYLSCGWALPLKMSCTGRSSLVSICLSLSGSRKSRAERLYVAKRLAAYDKTHAEEYSQQAEALAKRYEELNRECQKIIAEVPKEHRVVDLSRPGTGSHTHPEPNCRVALGRQRRTAGPPIASAIHERSQVRPGRHSTHLLEHRGDAESRRCRVRLRSF